MLAALTALASSLWAMAMLRITLWDRRLAHRGTVVRVASWLGVVAAVVVLALAANLAHDIAGSVGPRAANRVLFLLAAVAPAFLLTESLVRVGQGEGMAAALYQYPLSPALIHAGELLAGLASPFVLGCTVTLGAAQVATGTSAPVALGSAALFGAFLLSLSFVLRLGASALLRRKTLRELALAASTLALLGLWIGMASLTGRPDLLFFLLDPPPMPDWAWYLPPAWFVTPGAMTPEVSGAARWVGVMGAPLLVLAAFGFGAALQDMAAYGEAEAMLAGGLRRGRRGGVPLTDRWPLSLVHPAVWAAAGKEVRSIRRDPFLLLMLSSQGVLLLVIPLLYRSGLITGRSQSLDGAWGAYMPFFVLLLVLAKQQPVFNQVAMEGRGLLFLASMPVDRWKLVLGKNLAFVAIFGSVDVAFMGIAAWIFDAVSRFPYYLAMAGVGLVLMLGVGNLVSVLLPAQWMGARAAAGGARAAQAAAEGGIERPGCGVTLGRMLAVQVLYVLLLPPLFGLYAARAWLDGGPRVAALVAVFCWCALVYVVGTSLAVAGFHAVEERLRSRFAARGSG